MKNKIISRKKRCPFMQGSKCMGKECQLWKTEVKGTTINNGCRFEWIG